MSKRYTISLLAAITLALLAPGCGDQLRTNETAGDGAGLQPLVTNLHGLQTALEGATTHAGAESAIETAWTACLSDVQTAVSNNDLDLSGLGAPNGTDHLALRVVAFQLGYEYAESNATAPYDADDLDDMDDALFAYFMSGVLTSLSGDYTTAADAAPVVLGSLLGIAGYSPVARSYDLPAPYDGFEVTITGVPKGSESYYAAFRKLHKVDVPSAWRLDFFGRFEGVTDDRASVSIHRHIVRPRLDDVSATWRDGFVALMADTDFTTPSATMWLDLPADLTATELSDLDTRLSAMIVSKSGDPATICAAALEVDANNMTAVQGWIDDLTPAEISAVTITLVGRRGLEGLEACLPGIENVGWTDKIAFALAGLEGLQVSLSDQRVMDLVAALGTTLQTWSTSHSSYAVRNAATYLLGP